MRCKPFPLSVPLTHGIQCDHDTNARLWIYNLVHHTSAAVRIHEPATEPLSMPHDIVFLIRKLSYIQKKFHHRRQAILASQYMFFLFDFLPTKWQQKVRKVRQTCLTLQLAEVRAMGMLGKGGIYNSEEEANASVGKCPSAPPPTMDPANLANRVDKA